MAYDVAYNTAAGCATKVFDQSGVPVPPAAPSALVAAQSEKDTNHLSWTDNSGGVATFAIEVDIDSGGYNEIGTTLAGVTTYDDTPITIGSVYIYRVRAHGDGGYSAYSTASPITPTYRYGYPTFGSAEPDVLFQLLMSEGGGDLTDTVGGYSFVASGTTATYGVTASGLYTNLSPGITCTASTTRFTSTTIPIIDTSDFTIELWFKTTNTTTEALALGWDNGAVVSYIDFRPNLNRIDVALRSATGTSANVIYTVNSSVYTDGSLHKLRVTYDRDGNEELFIDGISYGTGSIAGISGHSLQNTNFAIGNGTALTGNFPFKGTIYGVRVSINLTNNSGGPNGG